MWNANRSSPSAATGETSAATSSTTPHAKSASLQRGTAVPRRASVRERTAYAATTSASGASCSGSKVQSPTASTLESPAVQVFHYHLVTSKVRQVEARYLGKLGFGLVGRHGRIADDLTSYESGVSWEELDRTGFKLRLSELERGSVNVVVQPGQWDLPRLDHLGIALDEDDFAATIERAAELDLRVQDHGGRRTFVATNGGFRLEVHPPREWLEDLLEAGREFRLGELHLRADDPDLKARALAELLGLVPAGTAVAIGNAVVRFLPGGPQGRPQLEAELFL